MKSNFLLISFLIVSLTLLAQGGEETGPLTGNPSLIKNQRQAISKVNIGTFDSTFIYNSDTIDLPIFDDFSSNKFQTYGADYTDIGVTFDKKYKLLDLASVPLSNNVLYTGQQTFRRTFDVANGTATDAFFPAVQVQIGDLSSYPVTYNTNDVYPPYYIYDTIDYPNDPDTIWIIDAEIFQDSATQFFAPISDPDLIWLDSEAFLNNTMAVDPWSIGVVTFDGLDENGYPYAIGTSTSGIADHLTSKYINLSTVVASDSLYLSFLYQPQGYSDEPEPGDSLYLEFYEAGAAQWNEIWKGGGGALEDF